MTELRPYQYRGARKIHRFRGIALNADEQGLGKTVQALFWLVKCKKLRPAIIVAPASMKYTWQAEALLHFGLRAVVLEGRNPSKKIDADIIVINYEILKDWVKVLRKLKPQCVIFDEIHYCKTWTSQRTKAAYMLARGVRSRIGLSGTPMTNRPVELWSVIKILRPDLFPSFEDYVWEFCKPKWTHWGWQYTGASNKKKLHRILKRELMFRRLKKNVMPELPPKERQMIAFKLKPSALSEYKEAERNFLGWLAKKSVSRAIRAKKSPALTRVGYLLRLCAELKLHYTTEWMKEFFISHPNEKLVAMTMHTFVIKHLHKAFPNSVVINGSVTGRKRHDTVRQFQSNSRVKLLLGNWKAAGVGLTLTAACNLVALDLPWTPGDLFQGEDRIHRFGQKRKVIIYYLALLATIEERLITILKQKSNVLDAILNGEGEDDDIDIFEELLKHMKD